MTEAEYQKFHDVLEKLPGHVIEFPELNMSPHSEPIVLVFYSGTFLADDFTLSGVIDFGEGPRYLGTSPEAARKCEKRYGRKGNE